MHPTLKLPLPSSVFFSVFLLSLFSGIGAHAETNDTFTYRMNGTSQHPSMSGAISEFLQTKNKNSTTESSGCIWENETVHTGPADPPSYAPSGTTWQSFLYTHTRSHIREFADSGSCAVTGVLNETEYIAQVYISGRCECHQNFIGGQCVSFDVNYNRAVVQDTKTGSILELAEPNNQGLSCGRITKSESCSSDDSVWVGNPINCASGQKKQTESLYRTPDGFLGVDLIYNRGADNKKQEGHHLTYGISVSNMEVTEIRKPPESVMGWSLSSPKIMEFENGISAFVDGRGNTRLFINGESKRPEHRNLETIGNGSLYTDLNGTTYIFGSSGQVSRIEYRDGRFINYSYPSSYEVVQTDYKNRSISIQYEPSLNGSVKRPVKVTDPAGNDIRYEYDSDGYVRRLVFSDDSTGNSGAEAKREYGYKTFEDGERRLSEIIDETGERYSIWHYDDRKRAVLSQRAGEAGKVSVEYLEGDRADRAYRRVRDYRTEDDYSETVYEFVFSNGTFKPLSKAVKPCPDCEVATTTYKYDYWGYLEEKIAPNGAITQYQYNARGGLERKAEAVGTPLERTTRTRWYGIDYPLVRTIERPGQKVSYTHTSSGMVASETVKDEVTGNVRTISYTYNIVGQPLTKTGPGENAITRYSYDDNNHLAKITNALGHTIHITDYDEHGNPLRVMDKNGVETIFRYSARGWLLSSSVAGQSTHYEYLPNGKLSKISRPNGAEVNYYYDNAQRLTAVEDGAGNRISYQLDLMGNHVGIEIEDDSGALRSALTQAYDNLGQLTLSVSGESSSIEREYDSSGRQVRVTDALGRATISHFDTLDQLTRQIAPDFGETRFNFNDRGEMDSVVDPGGLTTQYRHDGLGNLIEAVSPDTGTTTHEYDAAGNRIRTLDARDMVAEYRYDALNRLVEVRYPEQPQENIEYRYDETDQGNHGVGRLTGTTDASGHTAYSYNALGQLIEKRVTISGITLSVQYEYDLSGQLSGVTYPSGRQVHYERDNQGRIGRMLTQEHQGSTQALLEQASYLPFGPISEFVLGNGLTTQLNHDRDYRLTQITVGNSSPLLSRLYEYDPANNITGIHNTQDSGESENFTYDSLDRLTDALSQDDLLSYSYDLVGNRTEHYRDGDIETYLYGADSHRLEARDNTQYQYDAAGNTRDNGQYRFRYSASNRLIEVQDHSGETIVAEYRHNALGQRVLKRAGQATPDYLALAQEEAVRAEEHRQAAQHVQAQAQSLRGQAEDQHTEANTLTAQAAPLREQADTERVQSERHATYAEQLEEAAAQLTDEAAKLRASIVEPPGSFWDRLRNAAYTTAADAAEDLARPLRAKAAHQRADAKQRLAAAAELEQQAQNLEAQADNLIAAAQSADTGATSLEQQATDRLAQADTAEARAQEYRQLAEGTPLADARQTVYLYNETGQLIGEYDDTGTVIREYIYRDTAPLALAANDQIYYYHNDHLATPKLLTDANQSVVWQARHTPFGKAEIQVEQVTNNLRFPGQYFDGETGLHYNYFRDYDPETGRYIQSDPIGLTGGINTYAYVSGNPLKYSDPNGLIKLYGNWCGPDWTGGFSKPYGDLDDVEKSVALQPIDTLDACCMSHDITYDSCRTKHPCDKQARAECMKEADRLLSSCAAQSGGGQSAQALLFGNPQDRIENYMLDSNPGGGENEPDCECAN